MRNSKLAQKISELIQKRQVKMRSKAYFVLKTGLLILGIALVALFVLYLVSFIFFVLRANGAWDMPSFGPRGLRASFMLWPWVLILAVVILVMALEWLIKRYAFAYRRPIFYSVALVILVVAVGGFMIDRTPLHRNIFRHTQERETPFAGRFYQNYGMPKIEDLQRGTVVEVEENKILLEERDGITHNILTNSATKLMPPGFEIKVNDEIMVLGKEENGIVQALGIRKVGDDFRFTPRQMRRPQSFPMMR